MDKEKAALIVQTLAEIFADKPALEFRTPYELLVAVILSALSFRSLRKYRAAGGEWGGVAIAAALLAGLGILFSILSVILIVTAFVTKDPNSIYGFLYHLEP